MVLFTTSFALVEASMGAGRLPSGASLFRIAARKNLAWRDGVIARVTQATIVGACCSRFTRGYNGLLCCQYSGV